MRPASAPRVAQQSKIRIDKWLWHARFFKTRSLAAEVVDRGHIRVNRQPIRKPSHSIGPGDVLTFPQGPHVRVIEVRAISDRRGQATEAQALYVDLSPPRRRPKRDEVPVLALRPVGNGRPTKKERRETDRLRGQLGEH